jgi:putative phage-type endonuclease
MSAAVSTLSAKDMQTRAGKIGSSLIAQIAGVSPWGGQWDAWLTLTGGSAIFDQTPAQELGVLLEPVVAQLLERRTGRALTKAETVVSETHPWACATPDYYADDGSIVEIKTSTLANEWGAEGSDGIPDHYIAQVTWQMWVTGRHADATVAVLLYGRDLKNYCIRYDAELADALREAGEDFIKRHVLTGIPPALDGSSAASDYLRSRFANRKPEFKQAPPEAAEWVAEYQRAQETIKAAEAVKEKAQQMLIEAMGDAAGILGPWGVATLKEAAGSTDWKACAADFARSLTQEVRDEITAKHRRAPTQRFHIKGAK